MLEILPEFIPLLAKLTTSNTCFGTVFTVVMLRVPGK